MTPDSYYLIRMITGEDLIGSCRVEGETLIIQHPMKFICRRFSTGETGILLLPWLPEEIIQTTEQIECTLLIRDILCKMPLKPEMITFYEKVRDVKIANADQLNKEAAEHLTHMTELYTESMATENPFDLWSKQFESDNLPPDSRFN